MGVTARYQEDGELLVINSGSGERGFAVCLNCGYSESELSFFKHRPEDLPKSYEHHAPLQFAPTKNGRSWIDCRKNNGKNDVRDKSRSSVGFSPRFSEITLPRGLKPMLPGRLSVTSSMTSDDRC